MQENVILQRRFLKRAVRILNAVFHVVKAVCVHIEDYRVRGGSGVNIILIVGVCQCAVVSARIEDHAARIGIALLGHIYEPKPVPVQDTVSDFFSGVGGVVYTLLRAGRHADYAAHAALEERVAVLIAAETVPEHDSLVHAAFVCRRECLPVQSFARFFGELLCACVVLRERGENIERVGIAAGIRQGARLEKAALKHPVRRVLKITERFEGKPRRVVFPGSELCLCRLVCLAVQLIIAARDVLCAAVFLVPLARPRVIPGGEQLLGVFCIIKLHALLVPEKKQSRSKKRERAYKQYFLRFCRHILSPWFPEKFSNTGNKMHCPPSYSHKANHKRNITGGYTMKDVAYNPSALLVVGMLIAAAYTLLGI